MNEQQFNAALAFTHSHGLSYDRALECTCFLDALYPDDLHLQRPYAIEWIHRFRDDPTAHMDVYHRAVYTTVLMNLSFLHGVQHVTRHP